MSLMERLLKTLRYNFLTEALDFVGVHQERTLQVRGCRHCQGLRVKGGLGHLVLGRCQCPISEVL